MHMAEVVRQFIDLFVLATYSLDESSVCTTKIYINKWLRSCVHWRLRACCIRGFLGQEALFVYVSVLTSVRVSLRSSSSYRDKNLTGTQTRRGAFHLVVRVRLLNSTG